MCPCAQVFNELRVTGIEVLVKELLIARSIISTVCEAKLLPQELLHAQLALVQEYLNYASYRSKLPENYTNLAAEQDPKIRAQLFQTVGYLKSLQRLQKKVVKMLAERDENLQKTEAESKQKGVQQTGPQDVQEKKSSVVWVLGATSLAASAT